MKNKQLSIKPDLQLNDIMKCFYLAVASRVDEEYTYVYSLIVPRDKSGNYRTPPQINVEAFRDSERGDLAYTMKQGIKQFQSQFEGHKAMADICDAYIKQFNANIH